MGKITHVYYPSGLYYVGKTIDCGDRREEIAEIVEAQKNGQMAYVPWYRCLNAGGEVIAELNAATCESVHIEPEKEKSNE